MNKLVILVIEKPYPELCKASLSPDFFISNDSTTTTTTTTSLSTPTATSTRTRTTTSSLLEDSGLGKKRFCAGQIIGELPTGEISVQLYQPVAPLLQKAGAPPPSSQAEAWARILAVAASSYYVTIHPKQVIKECDASECPLTVCAALLLGQNPILFNVGTCERDGRIHWTPASSGYLSHPLAAESPFSGEGIPAA